MTSSVDSSSVRGLIPPTSRQLSNPSIEQSPIPQSINITIIDSRAPQAVSNVAVLLPIASIAVALVSVFIVHRLTRSREREKAVFDSYKSTNEAVSSLKIAASAAWVEPAGAVRLRLIAETKWRLQMLGQAVELSRRLSRKNVWTMSPPFRTTKTTAAIGAMSSLRYALTNDPFEDPTRLGDDAHSEQIEQAIGSFLHQVSQAFADWLD